MTFVHLGACGMELQRCEMPEHTACFIAPFYAVMVHDGLMVSCLQAHGTGKP